MKRRTIFLSLSFLHFTAICIGQKNVISLLNDRFSFTFPDSAKNTARAKDIMSADRNEDKETRVVYDINDKRIVFFAEEMYLKSISDLEASLRKESTAEYPLTVKQLFNKDSVFGITLTPSVFDSTKQAILTSILVIKNADNTLSRMSVYLNAKAYANKKTFDAIVDGVYASFKKGTRRLSLDARTEKFKALNTTTTLSVKLPKDYIVTKDRGVDFEVYNVRKVPAYGAEDRGGIIVYFGFYPSPFSTEYQLVNFKTAETNGEFRQEKIKWLNYEDTSRKLILREQLFPDDKIQQGAKIHIAILSGDPKEIEELTAIVRDFSLSYGK